MASAKQGIKFKKLTISVSSFRVFSQIKIRILRQVIRNVPSIMDTFKKTKTDSLQIELRRNYCPTILQNWEISA
ncbi:hypothetical protein LEP1GSC125_4195 [Leptospira mayottensis 200901122]|uniref:Uncharacterized protein n=2 Tax=Leptospira mayottensis TaxID=1137606 RepID=A0AA87MMZ5_9LEPT|nr:hypothetical protein DQM28_15685 [Leptospira mayottensis]AXR68864.1 hypothetical protein DPV73_13505 [Leptospira mayottensis]EKR99278.1 hypothetical protein LEP1GSC125_4195 [Leptospira mayottensis 200901122]